MPPSSRPSPLRSMVLWAIACAVASVLAGSLCGPRAMQGAESPNYEGVMVLQGGKVIRGSISPTPGGWLVERPGGSMVLPEEQVECTAGDLHEAYEKLRDKRWKPGVEDYLVLCRWCLTHQLYQEARYEVRAALAKDPERTDARRLLLRIEETLDPKPKDEPVPVKSRSLDGFEVRAVESLGGLPQKLAVDFTTRVHPIVVNKCGLGSCHGVAAPTVFHLEPLRSLGNQRLTAERNLAAMLAYIDITNPSGSQFIQNLEAMHGDMRQPVFVGGAGATQIDTVKKWVDAYARTQAVKKGVQLVERSPSPTPASPPSGTHIGMGITGGKFVPPAALPTVAATSSVEEPASFQKRQADAAKPVPRPRDRASEDEAHAPIVITAAGVSHGGKPIHLTSAEQSDLDADTASLRQLQNRSEHPSHAATVDLPGGKKPVTSHNPLHEPSDEDYEPLLPEADVRKILEASQPDAFDPDVFNRRYHGRSREVLVPVTSPLLKSRPLPAADVGASSAPRVTSAPLLPTPSDQ